MTNPAYIVGIGGILGAVLRHAVGVLVERESFPTGTLTVNIIGSFVLGLITFLGLQEDLLLLIGTGVCGSFTTFSSFSVNTVRLWEQNDRLKSVIYALANIVGALGAIAIARLIA